MAEDKIWNVCLKSKKEPIKIEAATVERETGQFVFKNEAGERVGFYNISDVEGYSEEPTLPPPRVR